MFDQVYQRLSKTPILSNVWCLRLLKAMLFIGFCTAIYYYIASKENSSLIVQEFWTKCKSGKIEYLLLTILLLPLNWFLEIKKWQYLTHSFQKLSWKGATLGVISGVTLSIFTPARIGEIGGRLINIKKEHIGKALLATLLGSFSQLVVLISVGIISFLYYVYSHIDMNDNLLLLFHIGGTLFIALMVFTYWNVHVIVGITEKIKIPSRFQKIIDVLDKYTTRQLNKVFLYSLSRYAVYCSQAVLLFLFLGVDTSLLETYSNVSLTYLSQTAIPVPAFLDLPLRGGISIGIWEYSSINPLIISACPFLLWILNICTPAIVGMILLTLYRRTKN